MRATAYIQPARMDRPVLTLIGDRQTGKTHTALLLAICQAQLGDSVLYTSHSGQYAAHQFRSAQDLITALGFRVDQMSSRNGDWTIRFRSGGVLEFRPPTRSRSPKKYALHVLDDDAVESPMSDRLVRIVGSSY